MPQNLLSGQAESEREFFSPVVVRLDGDRLSDPSYGEHILTCVTKGVGGLLVQGGSNKEVRAFLARAREAAGGALLLASPVGRGSCGSVTDGTCFPGPMAFAAALGGDCSGLTLVRSGLAAMASEARDLGINMPLLPFFGPEASRQDSSPLATIGREMEAAFLNAGLTPWRQAVSPSGRPYFYPVFEDGQTDRAGAEEVRAEMYGGDRLSPEAAVSGLVIGITDPNPWAESLRKTLSSAEGARERFEKTIRNMETMKSRVCGRAPSGAPVDYAFHGRLARAIAGRAVTLIKGRGKFLPLRDADRIPLVYGGPEEYFLSSPLRYYVSQASHERRPLPSKEKPVVVLLFEGPGNGSSTEAASGIELLVRSISFSIVVSFGDPSILDRFGEADLLVAAYDPSPDAQEAVFRCITGEASFEGSLPTVCKEGCQTS